MKKYTQREILSEGFWDGFKKVARGVGAAATVGGKLVDIALPEVTKPIKGAVSAFRDLKNAGVKAWDILKPRIEKIKAKMEELGFYLDESKPPQKIGRNYLIFGNQINGINKDGTPILDTTKSLPFIFDGENVKRATNASQIPNKVNGKKKPSGATPPPLPTSTPPPLPNKPASAAPPTPAASGTPTRSPRPISSPTKRRTP